MSFRRIVRWAVDEAGNTIGGTGYEGRVYLANTLTLASLWLDSGGSFAAGNPHSPNTGTQTSTSANMLTTDATATVLSTVGFAVGDLVPIDGSAGRFYGVIRTVTDATHLLFTQTLGAMGAAGTMNSGALVGGPEMVGHWQAFASDVSDYDFTLKNLATGKEGPPEGVATLSTAGTLAFQEEGVSTGAARPTLDFIGPLITAADDNPNNRVTVTVATPTAPGASAVGDTQSTGTTSTVAAADHRHAREAFATPAIVLGTAAAAGVATSLIRSDATIAAFDATAPVTQAVADAAAVGAAAFAARRDHKHGMFGLGYGLSGTSTLLVALSTASSQLGSDVAITPANTFVAGPNVSLVAGTWLIVGTLTINEGGQSTWQIRMRNTTDSATLASGSADSKAAGAAADQITITLAWIATFAGTKTVQMEAANPTPQGNIKAALVTNAQGNTASGIVAVRVA